MVRKILTVTTSRADLGHWLPVWRAIVADPALSLRILAVEGHDIGDWWGPYASMVKRPTRETDPLSISQAMGGIVSGASAIYDEVKPDIIVFLGDRWDMAACALAAVPFGIPIAHIGGGEKTRGAMDDALRNAITKLSHIHFVPHEDASLNLHRMKEAEWRTHTTGYPSIDGIEQWKRANAETWIRCLDCNQERRTDATKEWGCKCGAWNPGRLSEKNHGILVMYHPETLADDPVADAVEVGKALAAMKMPVTGFVPGVDVLAREVLRAITEQLEGEVSSTWLSQVDPEAFYEAMATYPVLLGNSSAGMIEASSFKLPVVNVGDRQKGRVSPRNVITVPALNQEIVAALKTALLRDALSEFMGDLENPYGDGKAAGRIVEVLGTVELNKELVRK